MSEVRGEAQALGAISGTVAVIGLSGADLSDEARELLRDAALVAGGERHLRELSVEPERSVALKGDLSEALARIEAESGPVAVLASGDPGFFGIVRLLAGRLGPERLRVLPAPSSVALAFGRVGLHWEDAVVVSVHGDPEERSPRRAVNVCRAHPKVCVLTSPAFGPAELARELRGLGREVAILERLGTPEERVFRGDAEGIAARDWHDPNVVLVLDPERRSGGKSWVSGAVRPGGRWGLPGDEFRHRSGMITAPEVRSVVLSKLGPGLGDLVWDVGAGSGSVAVECARFGAAAVAVERDGEVCGHVRENAHRHGVYVTVVEGAAPAALEGLPEPDAVFVGGSGRDFEAVVRTCAGRARRSVVMTLITLERVVPAARLLERAGFAVETKLVQVASVEPIADLNRLVPGNPVFVVSGERKERS